MNTAKKKNFKKNDNKKKLHFAENENPKELW